MCAIRSPLKCNVSHTPMPAVVLVRRLRPKTDRKLERRDSCKSATRELYGHADVFSSAIEAIAWIRLCSTSQWRASTGSQRCTALKRLYSRSESHVAAFTGERGDGNSIDGFPYISIISSKLQQFSVLDRLTTPIWPLAKQRRQLRRRQAVLRTQRCLEGACRREE